MNEEQTEFLELVETLLSNASSDQVYRHLHTEIGDDKVLIEDMVTGVYCNSRLHGSVIDMERVKGGNKIIGWDAEAAKKLTPVLKHYYILEMMAGI
jgi:hypothetical protein